MKGIAYGAQSGAGNPFEPGSLPTVDVRLDDGSSVLVMVEEPYGSDIAEMIGDAETWDELPVVDFEEYQVVGVGR